MPLNIIQVCNQIRRDTPPKPGQKLADYYRETWRQAIAIVEASQGELPLVKARREGSEAKLRHMFTEYGTLLPESENEK